jgi:hypothetical protein
MPTVKTDWNTIKLAFISDPSKPTLREFAGKHKIPSKTLFNRSSREKWLDSREKHWESVTSNAAPILAEMQATVMARDIAQRLTEIRGMADKAYRAIVPLEGDGLEFEKASDAVTAYDKLTKLERDLSKPDDKNSITLDMLDRILERYGVELVRAVNEHIRDAPARAALLRTIEERWANIPIVDQPGSERIAVGGSQIN